MDLNLFYIFTFTFPVLFFFRISRLRHHFLRLDPYEYRQSMIIFIAGISRPFLLILNKMQLVLIFEFVFGQ
jgi:hypothetical protein